jgi:hypothetical protein
MVLFLPGSETGSGGRAWFFGASVRKPASPLSSLSCPCPHRALCGDDAIMPPTLNPHAAGTVATACKLAVLFCRAMRHGFAYVERGLASCEQAYRQRQRRYLQECAAELGLDLVPIQEKTA